MLDKIPQIRETVAWLRQHLDHDLLVIDHWEADLRAIGVGLPSDPMRLVYIAVLEQPDQYFVELEPAPTAGSDLPYTMVCRFESVDRDRLRTIADDHLNRRLFDQDGVAKERFPCPCCGFLTRDEQPSGTFDICPVCFWEDDPVQFDDYDYEGGANVVSLRQAQQNFKAFGASERRRLKNVRPPREEEKPPCE